MKLTACKSKKQQPQIKVEFDGTLGPCKELAILHVIAANVNLATPEGCDWGVDVAFDPTRVELCLAKPGESRLAMHAIKNLAELLNSQSTILAEVNL